MKNRSRTHTPVDLGNQTCIGELMGTRDVVDWCTSIPLDTPLARLVTADPGTEMIEYDLMRLHKSERVELHTCGRCHHLCIEEYGASSGGGRLVGPVHQEEVWTRSSQREPARSNIHASTTA